MKFLFLSFVLMFSDVAFADNHLARIFAARYDITGGLKTALDHFEIDCGHYPTTSEGFAALINCPTNISSGRWRGPYIAQVPIDPWGNVYAYRCPGIHYTNGFDLYSCGPDGISRNEGDDPDDINNWNPNSGEYDFTSRNQFLSGLILLALLAIPFFGVVRLIATIFSQRVRDSIAKHPKAHIIWLLVSLAAVFIFFLLAIPTIAD
jgi:general secretion pathway protein G